jgi:hypothetical protein
MLMNSTVCFGHERLSDLGFSFFFASPGTVLGTYWAVGMRGKTNDIGQGPRGHTFSAFWL